MEEYSFGHHIQRDIIKKLISVESARYAEIRPKNIESNLFMYHLHQLIRNGFVQKTDQGYELTGKAKHFADRASLSSMKLRIQPKIITILTVQRTDGKWLLLERLHQPFLNSVGFPSGKIHYGEKLHDAAVRELSEKCDIDNIDLTLRGTFIMRFASEDAIANHIFGYVFSGVAQADCSTTKKGEYFRSFWGEESDLSLNTLLKGHPQLLELIKNTPKEHLFFAEHDFTSDF